MGGLKALVAVLALALAGCSAARADAPAEPQGQWVQRCEAVRLDGRLFEATCSHAAAHIALIAFGFGAALRTASSCSSMAAARAGSTPPAQFRAGAKLSATMTGSTRPTIPDRQPEPLQRHFRFEQSAQSGARLELCVCAVLHRRCALGFEHRACRTNRRHRAVVPALTHQHFARVGHERVARACVANSVTAGRPTARPGSAAKSSPSPRRTWRPIRSEEQDIVAVASAEAAVGHRPLARGHRNREVVERGFLREGQRTRAVASVSPSVTSAQPLFF